MPAPTATWLLDPLRLTRARARVASVLMAAAHRLDADDDRRVSGSGGGPLRARRRLARAQRQLERRSARASAWLRDHAPAEQRFTSPEGGAVESDRPSPSSPPPPGGNSDASAVSDGGPSDAGKEHPPPRRQPVPLATLDLNSAVAVCAGATPACLPASSATVFALSKEALQQRLQLLRRRDGLIEITIRTMKLMHRNQQLQTRLKALQVETSAFVKSVMSNPENRGLQVPPLALAAPAPASPDCGQRP